MGRYRFTLQARQDLKEITRFIALDNPDAARRFAALIKQQCKMLADFPEMGRLRDEFSPSLRSFPVGNYLIFYRSSAGKSIEVIAVVNGYRDIEAFLAGRQEN